jgi:hypothetical protein
MNGHTRHESGRRRRVWRRPLSSRIPDRAEHPPLFRSTSATEGIDTRPDGADLRGKHRPGQVPSTPRSVGGMIEARGILHPPVDRCTGRMHNTDAQNLCTSPASHPSSLGRVSLGHGEWSGVRLGRLPAGGSAAQRHAQLGQSAELVPAGPRAACPASAIHGGGGSGVPLDPDIWTPEAVEGNEQRGRPY